MGWLTLTAAILLATNSVGSATAAPPGFPHARSIRPHAATTGNCPPNPSGSGILPDGDFSQAPIPVGGYTNGVPRGTEFAPDWIVTGRTIDFVGPGEWGPNDPYCTVDLDGTPGPGGIRHSGVATNQGASYTVSFQFSGNGTCGPTIKTMLVKAAHQFQTFTWDITNGNDAQHGVWVAETWTFVAKGAITALTFKSQDPRGNCGPMIAAISVAQST